MTVGDPPRTDTRREAGIAERSLPALLRFSLGKKKGPWQCAASVSPERFRKCYVVMSILETKSVYIRGLYVKTVRCKKAKLFYITLVLNVA